MSNYMKKVNVPIAVEDSTKLELDHVHVTTADFLQLNVSYIREMAPGEKIDIDMESFARLNPMPVPTFGRANMKHFAVKVPFRTLWRGWNDFITDTVHIGSGGSNSALWSAECPIVTNQALVDCFFDPSVVSLQATSTYDFLNSVYFMQVTSPTFNSLGVITSAFDVQYPAQLALDNTGKYYRFTKTGRQAIKLLEQLGYKVNWNDTATNAYYSAMPLLALARAWVDWYYPNQYDSLTGYNAILAILNKDTSANLSLTAAEVRTILSYCGSVFYDADYFTAAFDNPNSPRNDLHSDFKIPNLDSVSAIYSKTSNAFYNLTDVTSGYVGNNSTSTVNAYESFGGANAPFISGSVTGTTNGSTYTAPAPISEYMLHSLHALTDYLKRNQLAGGRNLDRYLLRYGKALSPEKLNRSQFVGQSLQGIQIGDVMSTADTVSRQAGGQYLGSQLGSMAGKGMSYSNNHFSCETDEFAYILILTSIVPSTGYFQGVDRQVKRTTRLSFYTPEFDSLGSQPITQDELFVPQRDDTLFVPANHDLSTDVYGFAPRYADYKFSRDYLTGNFRLPSANGGQALWGTTTTNVDWNAANSWHLMRVFDINSFGGSSLNVVHSPNMLSGNRDNTQYKRLFYASTPDAPDNFAIIHNFEIASWFPGKSLYDTYEFEQEGRTIKADVGGVKIN